MEIEVPARDPRIFSEIKRHGQHLLQLKTVLFTIYYPASPPEPGHKISRQLWLGRPRLSVAQGYSHFAKLGSLGVPMFLPTMFTKLPAWRNAPLSDRLPPKAESETEPETTKDDGTPPTFPLMIFSHGLGGTNTCYSSLCGEVRISFPIIGGLVLTSHSSRAMALWSLHLNTEMVQALERL